MVSLVFNRAIKKIAVVLLLLIVVACSSTSGPVVIRDSTPPVPETKGPGVIEDTPPAVQPVAPSRSTKLIPVVEKLVGQSNLALKNQQYEKAINLAERGLRINRKEARLYWVLSRAYKSEGNRQQSIYFAKQGLRYADRSDDIYRQLSTLSR